MCIKEAFIMIGRLQTLYIKNVEKRSVNFSNIEDHSQVAVRL